MKPEKSKLEITATAVVVTRQSAPAPEHVVFESVRKITALRSDLVTEDLIGFRFDLERGAYEIYEDTEGFWELWDAAPKIFGFPKERLDGFYKDVRLPNAETVWAKADSVSA